MSPSVHRLSLLGFLALSGCSSDSTTAASGAATGGSGTDAGGSTSSTGGSGAGGSSAGTGGSSTGGSTTGAGGSSTGGSTTGAGGSGAGGSSTGTPSYADVKSWVDAYHAAHPGREGDITIMTDAQLAADPDAKRLHDLCGPGQLPVIPLLTWEYGGGDHAWINPDQSPLVICVYVATNPNTEHWSYDATADNIVADIYVLFPEQNPCNGNTGKDTICLGDPTNIEILVDTSSINDGAGAGLSLANSSTDLVLVMPDGSKVPFGTVQ